MTDFAAQSQPGKDPFSQPSKEPFVSDLKKVIADTEELLQATAHQTEGKVAELRGRIRENLQDTRLKLADAEAAIKDKTRQAAKATDHYVHENPWKSIGIAAGAGLLVGLLIGRR